MALVLKRRRLDTERCDPALAQRLRSEIAGEVLLEPFDRGRYSTDASIYQVEPQAVVVPRTDADVQTTLALAREFGVPVTARGGGTSQAGQTVGDGLIIDYSKHLAEVGELDPAARTVWVEPGVVLDRLNRFLRPHGLFFPVDISTSSRATLGGMAANNACGARSIRYGIMVDHLLAIDGLLADGERVRFGEVPGNLGSIGASARQLELIQTVRAIADREAGAIAAGFPKVLRRVGGYNLDRVHSAGHNMAQLLVGSEGTLALFRRLLLKLQPVPRHRALGVCHFPTFYQAMASTKAIVDLGPSAVELVDRTILELGRQIPAYRPLIERFVRGAPDALLLVEFAGDEPEEQTTQLRRLRELMADLGFRGAVVEATKPAAQVGIWEVRKAGLNIVMSMKGAGKPVSFIEDCAVPLEHLADYTARLTELFARHGTSGTWYAHASVGCLHVRPILNLKQEKDVKAMRAIAEEAFAMVRAYKGAHSGEHGDGLVRSEFHQAMFGDRLVRAFKQIKSAFDPQGVLNPGKIVGAPRMDDRTLFRYPPDYGAAPIETALDWSAWGGFLGAAEMCNNNGACRKDEPGVMCPSYRVTRDEQHVTRGRANSLRLALSGQLGPEALTTSAMASTLDLCVACKACRRECPTGVDLARMKIEVMHQMRREGRLPLRDRLIAYLPRYAPRQAAPAGCCICAIKCRAPPPCPSARSGSARGARCRAGIRGPIAPGRTASHSATMGATCSCSPTPSPPGSSRTTPGPRSKCSKPPAIGCMRRSRPSGGRYAAGAPSSRRVWSRKPDARPGRRSPRLAPSSKQACRSSASNRRACSPCATSSRRSCRVRRPPRSPSGRCSSKSSYGGSTAQDECTCRCAQRAGGGGWCTVTATRRRSGRWMR